MVNVLKEKGKTFDEVTNKEVFEIFQNAKKAQENELTEYDLEDIAGGCVIAPTGMGVVVGGPVLIDLAAFAAYRYYKKKWP